MSLLPSKAQVISALSDTQAQSAAAQSAQFLVQLSKNAGYAMLLLQIFDEEYLNIQTKHRILQELKRHLKSNWRARSNQITAQEKQQIKDSIIPSFLHCPPQHILIKTYKKVVEAVFCHQYRNWNIIPTVLEQLSLGEKIPQCLQLFLAFVSTFQFSITEQERTHFYTLTTAVLPVFLQLLDRTNNSQIVYLSIKFLWKAVHYEISSAVKEITLCWMPILQTIVGSSNPKYDNNVHQAQQRGSEQFYYFHSKKWATRILSRFIQKHAKKISFDRNNDNMQFSQKWYSEYGDKFIPILVQQFSINSTKKNRFFQMKCMNALIVECPDKVKQYSQRFQYDILLNFLRLSPQDEEIALKQPSKFIEKQNESWSIYTQIRSPATGLWVGFSELGSKPQKKGQTYQPGIFFMQNLEYLKGKLQEKNEKQLQVALYLLSSISTVVKKCKSAYSITEKMIMKDVIPKFNSSKFYVRARALEVFTKYNFIQYGDAIIQQSVQAICELILKEQYNFVKLKAISAFSFVTSIKNAKSYTTPFLKEVLINVLQLMQQQGQEFIGLNLETIINNNNTSSQISHFSCFIICHLHKIYSKMVIKERQQKKKPQYKGQPYLLAASCLKSVNRIIQSPLQQTIIRQVQPQILSIFQSAFMGQQKDYIDNSLIILEPFILKVEKISQALWHFYPFVIFNIIGARRYKSHQFNRILQQKNCIYFKTRILEGNFQMLKDSFPVLRNYIYKISSMVSQPNYQRLKSELISLLFHLISQTYKRGVQYQSGRLNIFICTFLMINLVQNFSRSLPPNLYIQIWQFVRKNMYLFRSRKLNSVNSQLIGLLLWANPLNTLTVAKRQNMLQIIVAQITSKNYEHQHQRARLILGINSVLSLPQKPSFIMPKIVELFKTNIKLVKQNIRKRHNLYPILAQMNSEELSQNQSDDQDHFVQQEFNSNSSALNMIDEIWEFGQVLQRLRIRDGDFYQSLANSIEDNITELRQNIRMAPKKSK